MSAAPDVPAGRFAVHRTATPRPPEDRARVMAGLPFGEVFTDHMARATLDGRGRAGASAGSSPTARSRSTRRPRCCTTARRSSRVSRPSGTPTARCGPSGRRPTPPGSPPPRVGWPCRSCRSTDFVASLEALVRTDAAWVPPGGDGSLYLRPVLFAAEPPARRAGCPARGVPGDRLAGGTRTSPRARSRSRSGSRRTCTARVRAGPGAVKTMGNYAARSLSRTRPRARVRAGLLPGRGDRRATSRSSTG